MEHGTGIAMVGPASASTTARRPRRYYRHRVRSLAYVNLDHANGGIIRDLSEAGLAIQSVSPLQINQQVHLRFELPALRTRVEATGRVAWADASGQGGLEFSHLAERQRRLLKEWIFIQLLAAAQHALQADSIFVHGKRCEPARELMFSASPLPAIQLDPPLATLAPALPGAMAPTAPLHLPGFPIAISAAWLSHMVDSLILLAAVLVFSLIALAATHVFPSWPIGIALAGVAAGIFIALYWFLFCYWIGFTPGQYLAQMAGVGFCGIGETEDQQRFR